MQVTSQTTGYGGDYTSAWDAYRRRRRWVFGIGLGGWAGLGVFAMLLHAGNFQGKRPSIPEFCFSTLILIWFVTSAIAGIRLSFFKCPRCGRQFFATWWYHNGFARRCVHCGLRKWAKNDSPEEDT